MDLSQNELAAIAKKNQEMLEQQRESGEYKDKDEVDKKTFEAYGKNGNWKITQGKKKKFTSQEYMMCFTCWLHNGRNAKQTAEKTGINAATIARWVKKGKPNLAMKPFRELVGEFGSFLQPVPFAVDPEPPPENWKSDDRANVIYRLAICQRINEKAMQEVKGSWNDWKDLKDMMSCLSSATDLEKKLRADAEKYHLLDEEGSGLNFGMLTDKELNLLKEEKITVEELKKKYGVG